MAFNLCLTKMFMVFLMFRCTVPRRSDQTNTLVVQISGGTKTAKQIARQHFLTYEGKLFSDFYALKHRQVWKRSTSQSSTKQSLLQEPRVKVVMEQEWKERVLYSSETFTDERWPDQWYLKSNDATMNVKEVWKKGITGNGVVVGVVDNGIETNHPELTEAYDSIASLDVVGNAENPYRRKADHGTKCAGVIAATANNSKCGVGVAYRARVGDIRLIRDTKATDYMEARALSHQREYIGIYSNSWGPGDAGWQVEGPGALTRKAFEDGVSKGRQNRGSIFVFAVGNGGAFGDMCGYNGYVNRIETITISGVNWDGHVPIYAEACAGIMAVAFSRDAFNDFSQVVTTAKGRKCTGRFSSTSAATAMATGTIALLLEANPKLSWRDVQHIIIRSARAIEPTRRMTSRKRNSWKKNKAGLMVSDYFGFGLIDTSKMVEYAARWQSVPQQLKCEISLTGLWNTDSAGSLSVPLTFTWGSNNTQNCSRINYLEHVLVEVNLTYSRRGDLEMELQSAQRTTSTLLSHRPMDTVSRSTELQGWTVKSLHFWGENPSGIWTLMMRNAVPRRRNRGELYKWKLTLYGTTTNPLQNNALAAGEKKKIPITRTKLDCQDSLDDCKGNRCNRWYNYIARQKTSQFCKRSCGTCKPVCPAVGVADRKIVPDSHFTALSSYSQSYAPYNARLNGNLYGWTPSESDKKNAYLQIDLGAVYSICAVATQGCKYYNEWIKTYKLQLSKNGSSWTFYQEGGRNKVFSGNYNRNTVVTRNLNDQPKAKFVRLLPVTYNNWPSVRLEIYASEGKITTTAVPGTTTAAATLAPACRDSNSLCPRWVALFTCKHGAVYNSCPKTCGACSVQSASGSSGGQSTEG